MEKRKYEDEFANDDIQSFDDFDINNITERIDIDVIKEKIERAKQENPQKKHENIEKKQEVPIKQETENLIIANEETDNIQSSNDVIINLNKVGLKYGSEIVLKEITLDIKKGDFVYLVGESGAGKSSIIKMLHKEVNNTSGDIYIQNENITNLRNKDLPRLRRKIGVIFQDYKLLSDKTIYQNVAFSLYVTGYPKNMIKKRVLEVLNKVGIEEQAQKYPDELSGGQQQRAAIARAIVDEPVILVADEPTGNLDPENALAIMELLVKINEEGTTVVMATHDVGIVNNFLNRVVLLGEGKVIKEAKGEYIYE
ncbi:MAG: cell division ATP-binding protein FtsE [Mycoplasmatales bacterium]